MRITTKEQALANKSGRPKSPQDRLISRIESEIALYDQRRPFVTVSVSNQAEADVVEEVLKLYRDEGHWTVKHDPNVGRMGLGTITIS